jgi:hypothetical protein
MIGSSAGSYQKALQVDYNKMNTRAIEKFLVRQIDARQRRDDAD